MAAPSPLLGKVAVVTGGAGGLGSAICRALATEGATLVVGYGQSPDRAVSLAADMPQAAGAVAGHVALPAPVTDSAGMNSLAARVEARFGRCDVLVNCAGITRFVAHPDLDGLDDELIDRIFSINVRGAFASVRAFAPLLRRNGNGLVVNISSIAAVTAMGSNIAYCASKAALDNMTRSLARALAPAIRVVSVSPGLSDTEFVRQLDQAWRNEQAERTPLKGLAQPEQVAEAVVAAATLLRFTTGAVIPVDGGRPLT